LDEIEKHMLAKMHTYVLQNPDGKKALAMKADIEGT
jgi:hypothetical protein